MSRRILIAALFVLGLLHGASAQTAAGDVFAGHWRQVASNAGQCKTCSLTVSRRDTTYRVVASNGWSAKVKQLASRAIETYVGGGRWERSPPRIDPKRLLTTYFVVKDERLHLTLLLTRPDGSQWRIEAVFERELPVA